MATKNKTIQIMHELVKEYPESFNNKLKAFRELEKWLNENSIEYKYNLPFELEILHKDEKELRDKIRNKVKELREKYKLCAYVEGLTDFVFGF